MRLITRDDEETKKSIAAYYAIGKEHLIIDYFSKKNQQDSANSDDWFYQSICQFLSMSKTSNSQKKHKCFSQLLSCCDKSIELRSDHWPALFMRSMMRSFMSSAEIDEMASYLIPTDYTTKDVETDLQIMIELQKKETVKQPYFFIPYVILAYLKYTDHEIRDIKSIIENGLLDTPLGPVSYFGDFLYLPIRVLHKELRTHNHIEFASELYNRHTALFPTIKI